MNNTVKMISVDDVSAILQAIRYSRVLPTSMLYLDLVEYCGLSADMPSQLKDYYVSMWLSDKITTHYNEHRQYHHLVELHSNIPRNDLITHLKDDYRLSSPKFEAWSVIFTRYVCLNACLSNGELAKLAGTTQRTLRRRQSST